MYIESIEIHFCHYNYYVIVLMPILLHNFRLLLKHIRCIYLYSIGEMVDSCSINMTSGSGSGFWSDTGNIYRTT